VACGLLAPLERGVAGVRPGCGAVRRGVIAAERVYSAVLLDHQQLLLGVEQQPLRNVISLNEPVVVPSRKPAINAGVWLVSMNAFWGHSA